MTLGEMLQGLSEKTQLDIQTQVAMIVTAAKHREENALVECGAVLNELRDVLHERSKQLHWPNCEFGTRIALCHSELSEALEAFRKELKDDHLPNRSGAEVELADCVIRILDLCGEYGFDIGGALVEKSQYNLTRLDHKPEERVKQNGKKF